MVRVRLGSFLFLVILYFTDRSKVEAACSHNENDTTVLCSGRGICRSGVCQCLPQQNSDMKVYGQFCECDNFSCDRSNGLICGGPDHGVCECGICLCIGDWVGSACDCRTTIETCIAASGEICDGHGTCECGRCKCFETEENRYFGTHCDDCPTCPGKCDIFKECVQCQVYQTGPLTKEECANCPFIPIESQKVEIERPEERLCMFIDESDDCKFAFKYSMGEEDMPLIHAQTTKDCPETWETVRQKYGV